jgi:hypothetical protein
VTEMRGKGQRLLPVEISIWMRADLLRALRREAADYVTASMVKRFNDLADKIERDEIRMIKVPRRRTSRKSAISSTPSSD